MPHSGEVATPTPTTANRTPRRTPPGARRVSPLALAAAGAQALALAVLYWACVRTVSGQRQEDALHAQALATSDAGGTRWLARVFELTAQLEPRHLVIGFVVVGALGLLRGRPGRALLAMGVAALTLGVTEVLKLVVLTRPELAEQYGATANSLPSGHTSGVLGLALGALVAAPRRLRAPLALLGAGAAGAMGAYVVDAGWHRVSDVLASALVGSTCLCLALALSPQDRHRRSRVAALALGVPAACAAALVLVYAWPGSPEPAGHTLAVLAPGAVVALTVLLAARALPREVRERG